MVFAQSTSARLPLRTDATITAPFRRRQGFAARLGGRTFHLWAQERRGQPLSFDISRRRKSAASRIPNGVKTSSGGTSGSMSEIPSRFISPSSYTRFKSLTNQLLVASRVVAQERRVGQLSAARLGSGQNRTVQTTFACNEATVSCQRAASGMCRNP